MPPNTAIATCPQRVMRIPFFTQAITSLGSLITAARALGINSVAFGMISFAGNLGLFRRQPGLDEVDEGARTLAGGKVDAEG